MQQPQQPHQRAGKVTSCLDSTRLDLTCFIGRYRQTDLVHKLQMDLCISNAGLITRDGRWGVWMFASVCRGPHSG